MPLDKLKPLWEQEKSGLQASNYHSHQELMGLLPQEKNLWMLGTRVLQQATIYTFLLFTVSGC